MGPCTIGEETFQLAVKWCFGLYATSRKFFKYFSLMLAPLNLCFTKFGYSVTASLVFIYPRHSHLP